MKKLILGVLIGFALASTISLAQQATEKRGMMGGMHRMMGDEKSGEGSSMQNMMGMMMKMMDQCNAMMGRMMGNDKRPQKSEEETDKK